MKEKTLKLYWWKSKNFGDNLNSLIFKKCFNIAVKHSHPCFAQAIGIGSILDRCLLTTKDFTHFIFSKLLFQNHPLFILSSGLGGPIEHYSCRARFFHRAILKRKIVPIILRGENTKKELEKLTKKSFNNVVLGDFGLLANMLLDKKPEQIYDIGICPQCGQRNEPIFKEIAQSLPNSILLDPEEDTLEFLYKLAQCKTIVSTGMHPLIAADSLGIPNLWATILDKEFTIYKCSDYYSALNVYNPKPVDIRKTKVTPEMVIQNYKVDKKVVEEKQKILLKTLEEFFANHL